MDELREIGQSNPIEELRRADLPHVLARRLVLASVIALVSAIRSLARWLQLGLGRGSSGRLHVDSLTHGHLDRLITSNLPECVVSKTLPSSRLLTHLDVDIVRYGLVADG